MMVKIFYDDSYVASESQLAVTRAPKWVADSLVETQMPGIALVAPSPVPAVELAGWHSPSYVSAVISGEPRLWASSGQPWCAQTFAAEAASCGGMVAAARTALQTGTHAGSLSTAFHHARYGGGMGYCVFNGLVMAAAAVVHEGGRAIIVDVDAHCGGGTVSMLQRHGLPVLHIDLATRSFDGYQTFANRLRVVSDGDGYLAALDAMLPRNPRADVVIYNAGVDVVEEDGVGGLVGISPEVIADREAMIFDWAEACGMPVAFALGGGYTAAPLVTALHRLTVSRAAQLWHDADHESPWTWARWSADQRGLALRRTNVH